MEPYMSKFCFSKKGFGLLEVMVAALVLGFLIVGLTRLQMGNREAALRIRTRDAAQIVAQQFIDSLSSVGVNSIDNEKLKEEVIERVYKWQGKNLRATDSITSKITYTIKADVNDIATEEEKSNFTESSQTKSSHVRAKKVDLIVSWEPFQDKSRGTQSINLSRIIK
jgi:prepilin-type N-terminal cleavage/methylation domain-containing protein